MRKAVIRRSLMVLIVGAIAYLLFWNTRHSDRVLARETSSSGAGAGHSVTLLSRTHTLDRIYQSMQGPFSNHEQIRLLETPTRELLWITGLRSSLVDRIPAPAIQTIASASETLPTRATPTVTRTAIAISSTAAA